MQESSISSAFSFHFGFWPAPPRKETPGGIEQPAAILSYHRACTDWGRDLRAELRGFVADTQRNHPVVSTSFLNN